MMVAMGRCRHCTYRTRGPHLYGGIIGGSLSPPPDSTTHNWQMLIAANRL